MKHDALEIGSLLLTHAHYHLVSRILAHRVLLCFVRLLFASVQGLAIEQEGREQHHGGARQRCAHRVQRADEAKQRAAADLAKRLGLAEHREHSSA
jgi:hypothetical protein